jgi:hypothetical protein
MLTHIRVGEEVRLVIKLMQLLLYLIMYVHGCWWFMLICEDETWGSKRVNGGSDPIPVM